jgi:hypothetical protein
MPVHARHLEVGQDHVGQEALLLAQRLEGVGGRLDLVVLVAQEFGQRGPSVDLVIDHQDPTLARHGGRLLRTACRHPVAPR